MIIKYRGSTNFQSCKNKNSVCAAYKAGLGVSQPAFARQMEAGDREEAVDCHCTPVRVCIEEDWSGGSLPPVANEEENHIHYRRISLFSEH